MGMYGWDLCSDDLVDDEALTEAVDEVRRELRRLGLPDRIDIPPARDASGFEEKMIFDRSGFHALAESVVPEAFHTGLFVWDVLVPAPLGDGFDVAVTARTLAVAVALPEDLPEANRHLQFTDFFRDVATHPSRYPPGPWRDDPACAFHVAVYLRAARYCLSTRRLVMQD